MSQKAPYIVGKSDAMRRLEDTIMTVAPTNATVLIYGESGTGKELVAKALHYYSSRAERPLIIVNSSAISPNLLEAEMFGHTKGAFTGAHKDRNGYAHAADKGTLFLDEIGEMPTYLQAKILRMIQFGEIQRVGSRASVYEKVNIRLIVATNRDLQGEVRKETFREDLFYRLKVIYIVVPPLRARKEDIQPLVNHFLRMYTNEYQRDLIIPSSTIDLMMQYHWHGNVRELESIVQRAVVLEGQPRSDPNREGEPRVKDRNRRELGVLDRDTLAEYLNILVGVTQMEQRLSSSATSQPTLEEIKYMAILERLTKCHGILSQTAKSLGVSLKGLKYMLAKMRAMGIHIPD